MGVLQHSEVLERLNGIFREVFENDAINLSDATVAADIDGWDSLSNIRLLVMIEQAFAISFSSAEVADIPNVGELVDLITERAG